MEVDITFCTLASVDGAANDVEDVVGTVVGTALMLAENMKWI